MSFGAWLIFAGFWAVFVTTPGPNAVNCISNGIALGFRRSLPGVLAILCQATLFLLLSAAGITALLLTTPGLFFPAKLIGAAFLIFLGVRGWIMATRPAPELRADGQSVFLRAFLIATINAKSVAGYFAAFTQFIDTTVPVWSQMWAIMPTALSLTALSYLGYTALGAGLGRTAMGAVFNTAFRRVLAVFFIIYGVLLGAASSPVTGR